MEDLSVVLKRSFLQGLYKKRGETFGTIEDRIHVKNIERKSIRQDTTYKNRQIPPNMTPYASPVVTRSKTPPKIDTAINPRLEKLRRWKDDKEKRKQEEKKNQKPLFKVTHVPVNIGLPKLDNVNKEIKGKPIKSKFAPPNHKFKPPSNIKPINLAPIKENASAGRKMVTRSQARALSGVAKQMEVKKKTPDKKSVKQKPTVEKEAKTAAETKRIGGLNQSMSPDYPITESVINDTAKTPEKAEPPVYVSPFVTMSRGKDSARKEYEARRSRKSFSVKTDSLECTSPKAGAAYFAWRLNSEISRLKEVCDAWNKYKQEENPPEEAVSMIDVAIGQTNLLLTKKFRQFQGLIDSCTDCDAEKPVTCEDLHGFWDMIHIQIVNLDGRFDNLQKLKESNWEEVVPELKEVVKRKGRPPKKAKASEAIKAAIEAARRQKQNRVKSDIDLEPIIVKKTPKTRASCHKLTAKTSNRNSSPGLMMMKVAQYAKGVDTPAKSILKSAGKKSVKSGNKTVLFEDALDGIGDIENDLNNLNLKEKTPVRRSSRISSTKSPRAKLF